MDTELLKHFLMVAKYKNFTKAAEHLFLGQPALSRRIADLEKQLDTVLFVRNNRSVTLTPAGEILQKEAENLIERLEQIQTTMRSANAGKTGRLKLGVLGNISDRFSKTSFDVISGMPAIEFEIHQLEQEELRQSLITGEIDIGLTFVFSLNSSEELEYRPVGSEKFVLLVPDQDPLSEEEQITTDMLIDRNMIILGAAQQPAFFRNLFSPNQMETSNKIKRAANIPAMLLMADAGLGIGIAPEFVAHSRDNYHFSAKELTRMDTSETLAIVWNRGNKKPVVADFITVFQMTLDAYDSLA